MIYDLILEGGGTRSIAFLGALQVIEARGHTYDQQSGQPTFNRLIAEPPRVTRDDMRMGHLRGLLRDFNTPLLPDFAEEQLDTLLFDILLRSEMLRPLLAFLELGNWSSDQPFLEWLASLLDTGSFQGQPRHFSAMTLREFYAVTGSELSLVVSDVTAYLERDISGHTIVDGQLFSPFPIELLLSDSPQVTGWLGPKQIANVLGFVLDTTIPVPGAPASEPERIIRLPAKGYGMMETQLSLGGGDALVKAGREAAHQYFERLADPANPAADDPLMSLSSPGAVQYIDDTARQQLAYVGMINYCNIDTQGGAYVAGSVITNGGDFTGRDNLTQQA